MASDIDRIRLAVALSALRFKPLLQSFPAYVLELQSQFPPSSPKSTDGSWRQFALSLERDLAALKEKYEAEKIKCLALENAASSVMPNSSSEPSAMIKKKFKKKPISSTVVSHSDKRSDVPMPPTNLGPILEDFSIRPGISMPRISPSDSLFSGLDNFLRLTSLPEVEPDLLLSVTLRTIEAAAQILNSVITSRTGNISLDFNTLKSSGRALHHVLSVGLPLLASAKQEPAEPVIRLLERTTTLVLNPLIHAFSVRSETYLNSLLCPPAGTSAVAKAAAGSLKPPDASLKPLPVDVRTDMLSLFRMIFCLLLGHTQSLPTLAKLSLVSHTLRASLILETVREIDRLLFTAPRKRSSSDPTHGVNIGTEQYPQTRSVRVKKLATKDSLCFLCTVLHILLSESSSTTSCVPQPTPGRERDATKKGGDAELEWKDAIRGREERLLSEGVSDALIKLITRCKRPVSISLPHPTQARNFPANGHGIEGRWTSNSADGATGLKKRRLAGRGNLEMTGNCEIAHGDMGRDEGYGGQAGGSNDVGGITALGVGGNAAGPLRGDNDRDHSEASVPQGASDLRDESRHDGPLELDEVSYGMLLGVMERYWVWSKSWEL